jgi:hypothetical protein
MFIIVHVPDILGKYILIVASQSIAQHSWMSALAGRSRSCKVSYVA